MKEWMELIAAGLISIAVIGLSIATLVIRLIHPEFTETQLFLYMLPYTGIALVAMIVGLIAVDRNDI